MASDKKRAVKIRPIEGDDRFARVMLNELVNQHHQHLSNARIELFWRLGWRAEADSGRIRLWKTVKADELHRVVNEWDFIILLNHEVWNAKGFNADQAKFVLDSALCECHPDLDRDGEQKQDENSDPLWRLVKPPVQTWPEIVRRYGFATADLQKLAEAVSVRDLTERPLFDVLDPADEQTDDAELPEEEEAEAEAEAAVA